MVMAITMRMVARFFFFATEATQGPLSSVHYTHIKRPPNSRCVFFSGLEDTTKMTAHSTCRVGQYDQVGTVRTTLTMLYCKYDTYDRLLFCSAHFQFQLRRKENAGMCDLVWMLKIQNAKCKMQNAQNKRKKIKKKLNQMPFLMAQIIRPVHTYKQQEP